MAGGRPDLQERRKRAQKRQVFADDRPAPPILFGIGGDGSFRFAKRGEIVELDFGAFDREGLGFHMWAGAGTAKQEPRIRL